MLYDISCFSERSLFTLLPFCRLKRERNADLARMLSPRKRGPLFASPVKGQGQEDDGDTTTNPVPLSPRRTPLSPLSINARGNISSASNSLHQPPAPGEAPDENSNSRYK